MMARSFNQPRAFAETLKHLFLQRPNRGSDGSRGLGKGGMDSTHIHMLIPSTIIYKVASLHGLVGLAEPAVDKTVGALAMFMLQQQRLDVEYSAFCVHGHGDGGGGSRRCNRRYHLCKL